MSFNFAARRTCFGILALCLATALPAAAAAYRPTDDKLVIYRIGQQLHALQQLRKNPELTAGDAVAAIAFAKAAVSEARRSGDARLLGQAETALKPWWNTPEASENVVLLRATIRQAVHDFPAALADLDQLLAAHPQNIQARLTRAFILMVTGDYVRAGSDCDLLADRRAMALRAICLSRLAGLRGHADDAFNKLARYLQLAPAMNGDVRRFGEVVLAELATASGQGQTALAMLEALTDGENADVTILAAQADLLLAEHKPTNVLTLLDGRDQADALLLRRAMAARQLNDPRLGDLTAVLGERFDAARASGNSVHRREEAMFALDVVGDAQRALTLAGQNWDVQKEPPDAVILLRAALAAGRIEAARPVVSFIADRGMKDARLDPVLVQFNAQGGVK